MTLDECDELFARLLDDGGAAHAPQVLDQLLSACDVINAKLGRGSTFFWRARKCGPLGLETEADLWHPPAHLTKPGRLNALREPILYLSTNEETALTEVHAQPGDFIQLTAFRLLPDETLWVNCIGEVEHVMRTGYLRVLGRDPDGSVLKMVSAEPYEKARVWAYVDAFLAEVLADPLARQSDYRLTRLVAAQALSRISWAQAMFYPSVLSNIGMNLGVKADAAKNFSPMISFVAKIGKVRRYDFHDVQVIRQVSDIVDGRLEWAEPSANGAQIVFNGTEAEYLAELKKNPNLVGGPPRSREGR